MAKGVWRVRLRLHFARDVTDCQDDLAEAILWIQEHYCKGSLIRMRTREGNRKSKAEFNEAKLLEVLQIHAKGPGFACRETVMDDGASRFVRQKCNLELITWNKWKKGFYPFKATSAYSTPSSLQCFWEIDASGGLVTSKQLHELLEKLAVSLNVFYAWAGLCYSVPSSATANLRQLTAVEKEVMEALLSKQHADVNDGDDIDYRERIRGVFWFNCLGPGHIGVLGGAEKIMQSANAFSPQMIGKNHILLSLSDLPPLECTDEVFHRHAALADYLKGLFPKATIQPRWLYRYEPRLTDGRNLTPTRWLRRFIDNAFLEKHGFQLAPVKRKKRK